MNPDKYISIVCAVCSEANDDMILTADVVANLLAQKKCSITNTQAEDDEKNYENDEIGDEGNCDNLHAHMVNHSSMRRFTKRIAVIMRIEKPLNIRVQ